jgi:2-polyprenyl-3-methyl-5-hydroxy-6-metoxy-1,4-benzoquinol methylase
MEEVSDLTCPICNSPARFSFVYQEYEFFECGLESCCHLFVWPTPTPEALEQFYDTSESTLENSGSWTMASDYELNPIRVHRFYKKTRIDFLNSYGLLKNKNDKILDMGCSTGMFLRVLRDEGFKNLHGHDISKKQVAYGAKSHLGVEFTHDLDDLKSGDFDLVTAYAVLEHVDNPNNLMIEINRVLKTGGKCVIDVPNYRSFYQRLSRDSWLWLIPPAHLQYFNLKSLEQVCVRNGFVVEKGLTLSTSSYLFLVVHHVYLKLRKTLPSTTLAGPKLRYLLIGVIEVGLRGALFPLSFVLERTKRHNQLIFVVRKTKEAERVDVRTQ